MTILSNEEIRDLAERSAQETLASETVEQQDELLVLALEIANIEVAMLLEAISQTQEVAA